MPLPDFENEADFRENWIASFLAKMGFILPTEIHGRSEQGKDFYFADHDRFGHLRFYAAQAKLGNVGAGQSSTDQLLNQVRRSFTVTLKHHKGADRQRISAVYVMASGTISVEAREYISDACRQEHYGENVYYLDGERLYNLDRHATYEDDKVVRQRLSAFLTEITLNVRRLKRVQDSIKEGNPRFCACSTVVLEEMLKMPPPDTLVDVSKLYRLWLLLYEINKRHSPLPIRYADDQLPDLAKLPASCLGTIADLEVQANDALSQLNQKYTLELSVNEDSE